MTPQPSWLDVPAPHETRAVRVLLVEDDPGDAMLVRYAVARQTDLHYELDHVQTCADALVRLERSDYDLILLDLTLPDTSGIETVESIISSAGQAAIVVLTGHDSKQLALEIVHAGAQDYLVKQHLSPDELGRAIRYAIERKLIQRQQLRLREDFIANVSHELRTPLSAGLAALDLLIGGNVGELSVDQRELLIILNRNLVRLKAMVGDLIDMSSIQSGKLTVMPRRVSVAAVVQQVVDALQVKAESLGLSLHNFVDPADELPSALCDPNRLQQILMNLVTNAIKFTPEGGSVSVGAQVIESADQPRPEGNVAVVEVIEILQFGADRGAMRKAAPASTVDGEGKMICLSVVDTGPGIDPGEADSIFDRLYQVTDGSHPGGLGIGLYLCKQLVTSQKGQIWLEDTPIQGATFKFTLPLAE